MPWTSRSGATRWRYASGTVVGSKLPLLENVAKSVIHRSTSSRRETIHRAIGG